MGFSNRDYPRTLQDASSISTFSSRVYGWMSLGLAFTATVAYVLFKTGIYAALMPYWFIWVFGSFGVAMAMNGLIQRASFATCAVLFLTYAGLQGVMFGTTLPLFAMAYGGGVIWSAFAMAAALFLTAMGYGMFTKSDLTSLGKILRVALFGLIAATFMFFILSFFIPMTFFHLLISYLGLIIFIGLTAYDAQTIRRFSLQADVNSVASYKLSLVMALKMYINVIMIFWYLLQIFSNSRR